MLPTCFYIINWVYKNTCSDHDDVRLVSLQNTTKKTWCLISVNYIVKTKINITINTLSHMNLRGTAPNLMILKMFY